MEKAQLCKSVHNNQLQQSICPCHKRKMSQIWQVNTHFGRAKVKDHTMMHTYTPYPMSLFTVVLTPKPFKTAVSAILHGRPRHLHSLGLNKGSTWLSHLKRRTLTPAILTFFLAITLLTVGLLFVFCGI